MTRDCPCGRPLHYSSRTVELVMQGLVDEHGADVRIHYGARIYSVPRHYIALHGLAGRELPELAERYGWKTIDPQ